MTHEEFQREQFLARVERGVYQARQQAKYAQLRHILMVWAACSTKPLKFPAPARRRRQDREIPKAA